MTHCVLKDRTQELRIVIKVMHTVCIVSHECLQVAEHMPDHKKQQHRTGHCYDNLLADSTFIECTELHLSYLVSYLRSGRVSSLNDS
jgi:hypothetical protein